MSLYDWLCDGGSGDTRRADREQLSSTFDARRQDPTAFNSAPIWTTSRALAERRRGLGLLGMHGREITCGVLIIAEAERT